MPADDRGRGAARGPQAPTDAARRRRAGPPDSAGAAALIAGLTIAEPARRLRRAPLVARLLGRRRRAQVTITNCRTSPRTLIPNIIFEIVAGGALASLVVPLVAGAIARGDRATVGAHRRRR